MVTTQICVLKQKNERIYIEINNVWECVGGSVCSFIAITVDKSYIFFIVRGMWLCYNEMRDRAKKTNCFERMRTHLIHLAQVCGRSESKYIPDFS